MIKVDLHNHLGKNGANPGFDETIDIVYNRLGPNSIFGICNDGPDDKRFERFVGQKGGKYNRVFLSDEKRAIYVPEKDIFAFGVEEVEPKQGHVLAVGMPLNKKIQKDRTLLDLVDVLEAATDFGCIKIPVHSCGKEGIKDYLVNHFFLTPELDGWEVYNASAEFSFPGILPFRANQKSMQYYKDQLDGTKNVGYNTEIGACAFTDGHSVSVIGTSYTALDMEKVSVNSLKNAIKQNRDFINLHMEPNKGGGALHFFNMGLSKLKLR